MATTLTEKVCTPCKGGIPPMAESEAESWLAQTPGWSLADEATRIERTFQPGKFKETLAFVNQVGELAEAERHHPVITFGWGFATISLQTKKIKGLHENDFIMAAKINALVRELDDA